VFVHDDGEPDATLFLGGVDWEPRRVSDAGLPDVGDVIVNDEEPSVRDRLLDRDSAATRGRCCR
jgi:hypothetical protein